MSEALEVSTRKLDVADGKLTFIDLPLDDSQSGTTKKKRNLFELPA